MATDNFDKNIIELEKQAGTKAARTIQRNWKNILATSTTKRTGLMLQLATARPNMKFDMLDSVIVSASPATWIQNYGVEGIKSNGIRMSMKPYHHFDNLFKVSESTLTKLLAEITEIRGEKVTKKIQEVIKFEWQTIEDK